MMVLNANVGKSGFIFYGKPSRIAGFLQAGGLGREGQEQVKGPAPGEE